MRRPEQLILQDDPAFLPDLFPVMDLDFSALNLSSAGSSKRSSLMSAQSALSSVSSHAGAATPLGLHIPGTSGSSDIDRGAAFNVPDSDQTRRRDPFSRIDDENNLLEDVDFIIDDEGKMVDVVPGPVIEPTDQAAAPRVRSDSLASVRVRQEHEEGRLAGQRAVSDRDLR